MIRSFFTKLDSIKSWFLKRSLKVKIGLFLIIITSGWFAYSRTIGREEQQPSYQTAQVERGTLIVSVSGSGQVASVNNASVTTQATGVVNKLYVKDGDSVKAGDPIADIDLDLSGKQKSAAALASYQSAKNTLETARANVYSTQSTMFTAWDEYVNLATNDTYENADGSPNTTNRTLPEFYTSQDDWLASEAKYKIQQEAVRQGQTALNSSWLSYQQTSPTIYAPISGTVSGLSLQVGSVISSSTTTTDSTNNKIANIITAASPSIMINLTEIDIPKITIGDHATVTFDAISDKTFTGKVISIDTVGTTSSGVTTYPTVIQLDTKPTGILPNMAASASIITDTKDNVLMIPAAAVTTQNGSSTVRVMKNDSIEEVSVEVGLSTDTSVEIVSGVSEGDTIITGNAGTIETTQTGTQQRSVFSPFGGGGGGAVRINR